MSSSFAFYTEISARAMQFNPKMQEVVAKKQEILDSIQNHHNCEPNSVLFYGFSPLLLACRAKNITVSNVTAECKNWLDFLGLVYQHRHENSLRLGADKFDWVIAGDEFFTFAESENQQKTNVETLVKLTQKTLITTLRDYKNFDYKDREFSYPLVIHNSNENLIFLEYHSITNKNSWTTTVYEIQGDNVEVSGPFNRCSMFFKQLAKFSIDAGANNFYVHKNLMYKSVIKKNYEHVISINI